jgi:hypothetical protein
LEKITEVLNNLSENPEQVEKIIKGITAALITLGAVRIGAGVISFIANLKSIKSGKIDLAGAAGGGAGIPVHVTNWGGAAGTGIPHSGSGLLDQFGNPLTGTPKPPAPGLPGSTPAAGDIPLSGAIGLGIATAATLYTIAQAAHSKLEPKDPAVPGMSNYYNMNWGARRKAWAQYEAEHPEEMTYDQRVRAAGYNQRAAAARGDIPAGIKKEAGENPAGKRAGTLDMWGESRAVRTARKGIGTAAAREDIPKIAADEINAVPRIPQGGGNPVLEGSARLENYVYLYDKRTEVQSLVKNNTTPIEVNTGSAAVVRESAL